MSISGLLAAYLSGLKVAFVKNGIKMKPKPCRGGDSTFILDDSGFGSTE
jgi:hypothetical protein